VPGRREAGRDETSREDLVIVGQVVDVQNGRQALDEEPRAGWLSRHRVTLLALAMIIAQLVWKANFLSQFYFRQDDIHFTEIALGNSLDWKYLSYVGSGHLHPGVLLIVWILARAALYDWAAACAVTLLMLAVASLAAWWLLRTLIGNRPAILIPLALYLVSPLTFPNDSWWQSGIESLPLQAVIFLSLIAHVHYVRTRRARHLVAAAGWLILGMVFFEKAAVVPVLLFGVTAGFLLDGRIAVTVRQSLVRYWRAWALYAVLVGGYAVVLREALRASTSKPTSPSLSAGVTFSADLAKETLVPGLLGGPWQWFFSPNNAVAYSAPGADLVRLSLLAVAAIIVASVMTRPRAWRAWAILAVWVVLADIVPVLLGRLATLGTSSVLQLDTRYVADAAPVAAICVALAFWPAIHQVETEPATPAERGDHFATQTWGIVGLCLTCVIILSSVWSVRQYEDVTKVTNAAGKAYWHNVRAALSASFPAGTQIFNESVPGYVMLWDFYGKDAIESAVLGPLARSTAWTAHPSGTIDNLGMFSNSGTLAKAKVQGAISATPAGGCWTFHHGSTVIPFTAPSPAATGLLRIGYLAGLAASGETVVVSYGTITRQFVVAAPGLHSVYLQVTGSATDVTVAAPASFCIGDVEAGNLVPSAFPLVPAG
jgi:hypothetical protein